MDGINVAGAGRTITGEAGPHRPRTSPRGALTAVNLICMAKGRISKVYLLDAAAELALFAA